MSSLAGKQGPRYRHTADDGAPYEAIAVEKLTPIIGAEISGVDIGKLVEGDSRDRYAVRSGARVTSKAKDFPAVMLERLVDVAGVVGRPGITAAE